MNLLIEYPEYVILVFVGRQWWFSHVHHLWRLRNGVDMFMNIRDFVYFLVFFDLLEIGDYFRGNSSLLGGVVVVECRVEVWGGDA